MTSPLAGQKIVLTPFLCNIRMRQREIDLSAFLWQVVDSPIIQQIDYPACEPFCAAEIVAMRNRGRVGLAAEVEVPYRRLAS
jgi:hypothetical protein